MTVARGGETKRLRPRAVRLEVTDKRRPWFCMSMELPYEPVRAARGFYTQASNAWYEGAVRIAGVPRWRLVRGARLIYPDRGADQ